MADTGWLIATNATTSGSGLSAWSSVANVYADDNSYTSFQSGNFVPFSSVSGTLTVSNFGASIPSGATIDGIEIKLGAYYLNQPSKDNRIQVKIGGSATGTNKATGGNFNSTTEVQRTYGGATDKWGLTTELTSSNINNSGFGVEFQCEGVFSGSNQISNLNVDYIQVKIYYTESGGGGTTVTAESGTLTLTGGNATITQAVSIPANTGILTLTGNQAVISEGSNVTAESGSLSLTGNEAVVTTGENVVLDSGSLILTGSNAVIALEDNITADTGILTLTGNSADISEGESITADSGSLILTGSDAVISTNEGILAETGTLTLTGNEAVVLFEYVVAGESGSLTLTGSEASIVSGESVTLESGSLTLVGNEAVIISSDTVVADTGTLALTGSDAVITRNESIPLDTGVLALTGNEAVINESTASDVTAESGSLTITGSDANVTMADSVVAESGTLTLTGSSAAISEGLSVTGETGSLSLTGNGATITEAQSVTASTGTLTLSGSNVVINEGVTASSGTLTLTGSDAVITIDSSVTVIADTGVLTLSGNQALITQTQQVTASSGSLVLTGSGAVIDEGITASSGNLSLTGNPALIIANDNVPASSGTLTLVGGTAFIKTTLPPISGGVSPTIPFDELLRQRTELIPMRNQILLDNVEMERLRTYKALWKKLQNICDYQLNDPPQAVVTFNPDAIYSTEAGVNPVKDMFYFDSEKAYRHGLCYQITGETKYAVKAQQIIDDWAFKLREINGSVPQGYINLHITYFIMSATWVRNVEGWDGNLFEDFLVNKLEHLSRWERPNNIGAWGLLFNIAQASYMNDVNRLYNWSIAIQQQILDQVNTSGVMTEEVTRNGGTGKQGISYSNFGMLPWAIACEILMKEGYDIFSSPAGERLGLAYKQLMEWVLNPDQFPYYSGDVTEMNSPWQVTYVYIMRKYYEDANADTVISMKSKQEPNSFMIDFLYGFMWNPTSDIAKFG